MAECAAADIDKVFSFAFRRTGPRPSKVNLRRSYQVAENSQINQQARQQVDFNSSPFVVDRWETLQVSDDGAQIIVRDLVEIIRRHKGNSVSIRPDSITNAADPICVGVTSAHAAAAARQIRRVSTAQE